MKYHNQIMVSDRIIDSENRLIAGVDKKSGTYILLVPTIIHIVTELYYHISKEEYEAIRADKKAGFMPFLQYGKSRYDPIEDERFLGVSSFGLMEAV